MKHYIENVLLLLVMICHLQGAAAVKPETVDSLLRAYQNSTPYNKNNVVRQIIAAGMEGDLLTEQPLTISDGMPSDSVNLFVYYAAVRYYYYNAYFKECMDYVERALPLAVNNDFRLHATLLCDRCYCLFKQGRLTEAAEAGEEAMQFCLKGGPSMYLARAYLYLAIVNNCQPNPEQAKLFIQKAIDVDEQIGRNNNTHNILGIACEIYSIVKETDKAIAYGQRAVEEARAIGYDEGVVNHMSQLSYAYNRQGDYQRGLEVAQQAVDYVEKMEVPDRNLLAISLEYVAYNMLDLKRNAEAVPVLLRAIRLEEEVGNTRSVCYDYRSLAEAYEPDEPRQAIASLRKYIVMRDSIHNAEMNEALGQANAKFHNNELQEENNVLQGENSVLHDENSARQRQNRLIIIASAAVALLLLVIIAFVVYAYRLRGRINRSLKRQQLAQEAFFTNITHEFRTPLTVILGLSRQLQEKVSPKRSTPQPIPQKEGSGYSKEEDIAASLTAPLPHREELGQGLSLIEQQGNRLLELVNQVLDVAKMKSATIDPQWQHGNIVPLLDMFTNSLQQLADSRQVKLTYKPDGSEQNIDFVSDYMQKIVINLLSNALKNTQAAGSVTMTSRCSNGHFILKVSDTGNGIAAEDLPFIFEPFYQGSNAQRAESTGIGLTLTQQLVQAMRGTITVESTPGEGTTFTVSLPQQQKGISLPPTPSNWRGSSEAQRELEETMQYGAQTTSAGSGLEELGNKKASPNRERFSPSEHPSAERERASSVEGTSSVERATSVEGTASVEGAEGVTRVLVVEDSPEVAYYTGSLLEPHYEVVYAADGEEGFEKAQQLVPDIIVTDVMMPRMDGLELCRRIRNNEMTCHIPVVVVTAKVTDKDRLEGLHAGALAYLNKPFNADELLAVVGNLFHQQKEIQKRVMSTIVTTTATDEVAPESVNDVTIGQGGEINEMDRQLLERLHALVVEHMEHGETDVEHLAPLLAMSQTQLRRKIAAVTGVSAARYITCLRIEEAKKLLRQYPAVTIIEVAFRTGFADNSHFTKVFRRFTGMTPLQFIKEG